MKKTLHFFYTLLALVCFPLFTEAQTWNEKITFPDECKEKIDIHLIPGEKLRNYESDFHERYRCNPRQQQFEHEPASLSMKSILDSLYADANKKMNADTNCVGRKCMTGFKVDMGLTGRKTDYIFQAIYLKPTATYAEFSTQKSATFYHVVGDTLQRIDSANAKASIDRFHDSVRVRHFSRSKKHTSMNHSSSWKGDTKAMVFTFQELVGYYDSINNSNEGNHDNYTKTLAIHNGCFLNRRIFLNRWRAKQTLFITMQGWSFAEKAREKVLVLNADGGLDFAHLCPPSCNELTFELQ